MLYFTIVIIVGALAFFGAFTLLPFLDETFMDCVGQPSRYVLSTGIGALFGLCWVFTLPILLTVIIVAVPCSKYSDKIFRILKKVVEDKDASV